MTEISKINFRIDGEDIEDHAIDVDILAPSLVALSALIKEANKIIHKDEFSMNLKVNAGVEQNCFELLLLFGLIPLDQMTDLFSPEIIERAEETLKWLGIARRAGKAGIGVFQLLKHLKGKPIEEKMIEKYEDKAEKGEVDAIIIEEGENITVNNEKDASQKDKGNIIIIKGGKNITVNNIVRKIYNSPEIRKHAQDFMKPLENKGIDKIAFSDEQKTQEFTKKDYAEFLDYDIEDEIPNDDEMPTPRTDTAHLKVYKPELAKTAKKWSFLLDKTPIDVDISATKIAPNAILRGGVGLNDTYTVELQRQEYSTRGKQRKIKYKIIKVLNFEEGVIIEQKKLPDF